MRKTVKIKICGLSRPEDILAVNEAKPDYCGFIIDYPKSFRNVSPEKVRELVKNLDKAVVPVGVFVNRPPEQVAALLNEGTIAMAQLHGQEDEQYISELRQLTAAPIIKAFTIKTTEDAKKALRSAADYILLDRGRGTGETFEWSVLPKISRPWFLAGGLGPDNLADAAGRLHPYAVDLSSGVETDRKKDPQKILQAVKIIRNCETCE